MIMMTETVCQKQKTTAAAATDNAQRKTTGFLIGNPVSVPCRIYTTSDIKMGS
jgi:hypothetical protein